MRSLTCLDRDRELRAAAPAGSLRSESTEERLQRILLKAQSTRAPARVARYNHFFDRTIQGRRA